MPKDNDAFLCNHITVYPPSGVFGREGERGYDACVTQTFGPVPSQISYDTDSARTINTHTRTYLTVGLVVSALKFGTTLYKSTYDRNSNLLQNAGAWCLKKKVIGRAVSQDVDRYCDDLVSGEVNEGESSANDAVAGTLINRGTIWKNFKTSLAKQLFSDGSGAAPIILDTVVNLAAYGMAAFEIVRTIETAVNEEKWIGKLGPILMKSCKYASSFPSHGLFFCNFNDGSDTSSGRWCYSPMLGQRISASSNEVTISVSHGVRVEFTDGTSVYTLPNLHYLLVNILAHSVSSDTSTALPTITCLSVISISSVPGSTSSCAIGESSLECSIPYVGTLPSMPANVCLVGYTTATNIDSGCHSL